MMKKTISFLAFLFCIVQLSAQQVFFDVGRVAAGFDYKDSDGQGIDNIYPDHQFSYALGYRHVLSEYFYPVGSIVYSRYGLTGSDPLYDNSYTWEMGYLGFSVGMEGEPLRRGPLKLVLKAALEPQFFMDGRQTINGTVYDLRGVEQFENPFVFFAAGIGVNYCIESNIALSVKYKYSKGFPMGSSPDPEVLRIDAQTVSLGILIGLGRLDYCQKTHF